MTSRFFEDFAVGEEWVFEPWTLDEDAIVEFARNHDPQPMHTDAAAAADGPYGGLIASGWQTALACVGPFLNAVMRDAAGLASPGFETFKWLKPVRPGVPVTPTVRVVDCRRSSSRPDRGIVRFRFLALDEDEEAVWDAEVIFFIAARGEA